MANFQGADLTWAKFHAVHDKGAIFRNAKMDYISKTDSDLIEAEEWKPPF